jgi:hypothetical protein
VGGFDRDRRRRPHPRRLAISDSRSADGRPHAVPFRRRTGASHSITLSASIPLQKFSRCRPTHCSDIISSDMSSIDQNVRSPTRMLARSPRCLWHLSVAESSVTLPPH